MRKPAGSAGRDGHLSPRSRNPSTKPHARAPHPEGNGKLLIGIIAAVVAGALLGGLWPETGASLHFSGKLFVRFLMMLVMMLVMPLIVAAMVTGILRLGDIRRLGSLG